MKDTQNSLGHCHMLLGGPTLQEQPQEQVQHSNISEEQPQLPPVAKKHFVLFVVLIFKGLSNFGHIRGGGLGMFRIFIFFYIWFYFISWFLPYVFPPRKVKRVFSSWCIICLSALS